MVVIKTTTPLGEWERELTPLLDTLHNIMLQFIDKNILTLPLVRECDPNKPFPRGFQKNSYCHYDQQNGHGKKYYKCPKHHVQELIVDNQLQIGGVNDQGNTYVASPDKKMKIFANPMPKHTISFVKASETKNDVMNVDMDDENINEEKPIERVTFIEARPHKGSTKKPLDISFSQNDMLKRALDGSLYIAGQINDKPTNGISIDRICGENVITREFLYVYELYQETYEKLKAWIKMNNGFSFPMIGLIDSPLEFGPKTLTVLFSIILQLNQFCVKLGYPLLCSMNVVPLLVHKCLKFLFANDMFTIHHSGFNLGLA